MARESLLTYFESAAGQAGEIHLRHEESVSFGQLWSDAHGRAGWIERRWPGDVQLAGILEPTRACLTTLFGCWIAGRTFISLPSAPRGATEEEYEAQLATLIQSQGDVVICRPDGHGSPARPRAHALRYSEVGQVVGGTGREGGRLVQFTSGTTGSPGAVSVDLHQLGANAAALAERLEYSSDDVFFSWLPLSHDMGLVGMCLGALAAFSSDLGSASALHLSRPEHFVRDPANWLRTADEVGGTVTMAPAFALDVLARRLAHATTPLDLSRLRAVVVGAEEVTPDVLRRFAAATQGTRLRDEALCPAYGLAEATLAVTVTAAGQRWRSHRPPPESDVGGRSELTGLGTTVEGVELRIAPGPGGVGEVELAGETVVSPGSGCGAFTPDGWLRTGDFGFLADGELCFVRRSSSRLVVAGRTIDAVALEREVSAVGGVRGGCCAVVAHGASFALVAEPAELAPGSRLHDLVELMSEACLGQVGIAPSRVVLIERGSLAKTPSGKVQRARIAAQLEDDALRRVLVDVSRKGDA